MASSCTNQCQHYYTLGNILPVGAFGCLDISGEVCISSSINSPSSGQISSITCNRSILNSKSICTLLDGGFLASRSSQHVGRHALSVSHHKRTCQGCSSRPITQGHTITVFHSLATQVCVLHTRPHFFSL